MPRPGQQELPTGRRYAVPPCTVPPEAVAGTEAAGHDAVFPDAAAEPAAAHGATPDALPAGRQHLQNLILKKHLKKLVLQFRRQNWML